MKTELIVTQYQLAHEFAAHEPMPVTINRTNSPFYPGEKWAVRRGGSCLAKDGEWEFEPSPSSRDAEFYERCRFDSLAEATGATLAAHA